MIEISEYPPNFVPSGAIPISATDEFSGGTVKGFYDPATKETHIQEFTPAPSPDQGSLG